MNLVDLDDARHTYIGDMGDYEVYSIDPEATVNIADIEPVRHGKWIPASERLPEHSGHYLVTGWHGGRSFVTTMDYHKDYYSGGWRYHEYDVIAWAETPKPYEGGQDDQRIGN